MFKSLFLVIFITFLTLGCDSNSDEPYQVEVKNKFLSIAKGPINSAPVSTNQKVYLEFTAPLNLETVNESTAYMLDDANNSVGLYIGIGNPDSKIILTPYTFLEPSTVYTIVVTTAIRDINGRSLSEDYRYEFSTQADSVDATPLVVRSLKPESDAPAILVRSEISVEFSTNLSLEPQYSNVEYLRVSDENGTAIAGTTEVFNSILKFIPHQPLPYEEYISVELMAPVSDMFNNEFSDLPSASWSFTTKTEVVNPKVNLGFVPFSETSLSKRAYLVRTMENNATESKIAVATQDGVDIYLVHYSTTAQPTFEYQYSYAIASKINAMVTVMGKYLMVGTMSNGVYLLEDLSTSLVSRGNYITTQSVYGLSLGHNDVGETDKLYAVGPELGLQIFYLHPEEGLIVATSSTLGEALDVLEHGEYDYASGAYFRKIYVADYNGSVIVCDENGTTLIKTDLNASVKKLTFNTDEYGYKTGVLAISSSGKMQGVDFDGSILSNVKIDLLSNVYDLKSYMDGDNMIYNLYLSGGDSGILVTSENIPNSIIDTGGSVVSSDIVLDNINGSIYLVTLNEDGQLQIFNALADTAAPYFYTTPSDENVVSANGFEFVVEFQDDYLDRSTITSDSFVFMDENNSVTVAFNLSFSGDEYKLVPQSPLSPNTNYSVSVSGNIADAMGNKVNGGADRVIIFETNSDVPLASLSIANATTTEDNNITFTVSLNEVATSNIYFDYATVGDTAEDAVDYVSTSGTGGIAAGELSSTITIEVKDDYEAESTETFFLNLSNPSANVVIADNQALGTITDDVDFVTIAISGNSYVDEGQEATYTLTTTARSQNNITIDLKVEHLTTDDTDITQAMLSATILAGDLSTTFNVSNLDDSVEKTNERIYKVSIDTVSDGGYEAVAIQAGISTTIIDNDVAQKGLVYMYVNDAYEYDDLMEFTIIMEEAISSDVRFDYETQDVTATAGEDYTASSGSGVIYAGSLNAKVFVPMINDGLAEDYEELKLRIFNVVNADVEVSEATGTITDDDY